MLVLVCTKTDIILSSCTFTSMGHIDSDLRYLIVATSELVVNRDGPANIKGSLATTRLALLVVNKKTLLKPPSFLL
jgi:hypothetical protein